MKISVITVSYNSALTIRDTFESVLAQTYTNIEYIVVDGASKDDTVKIIKEYEPYFKGKMRWISERDSGLFHAMNKGLSMATGDVIGILNSDDFFTNNNILNTVASEFVDNEIDAVYGDVHFVAPNDLTKFVRYYSSKTFRKFLMRFGFSPAHPSFYCQRKIYNLYGEYNADMNNAADFDLILRFIYIHKIKAKYIPLDMVTMRNGGISTKSNISRWKGLNEQLKSLKDNGVWSCRALLCLKYIYKITELIKK